LTATENVLASTRLSDPVKPVDGATNAQYCSNSAATSCSVGSAALVEAGLGAFGAGGTEEESGEMALATGAEGAEVAVRGAGGLVDASVEGGVVAASGAGSVALAEAIVEYPGSVEERDATPAVTGETGTAGRGLVGSVPDVDAPPLVGAEAEEMAPGIVGGRGLAVDGVASGGAPGAGFGKSPAGDTGVPVVVLGAERSDPSTESGDGAFGDGSAEVGADPDWAG